MAHSYLAAEKLAEAAGLFGRALERCKQAARWARSDTRGCAGLNPLLLCLP